MKPQEANKIIAEFMGSSYYKNENDYSGMFSKSLDALMPVIEKLKDDNFECFCWLNINKGTNSCEWKINGRHDIEENESPSVSLAIAIAKAISVKLFVDCN